MINLFALGVEVDNRPSARRTVACLLVDTADTVVCGGASYRQMPGFAVQKRWSSGGCKTCSALPASSVRHQPCEFWGSEAVVVWLVVFVDV